jgi:hypothetical protein
VHKTTVLTAAGVLWLTLSAAGAEPPPTANLEPSAIAEAFLEQVGQGDVDRAWDALPKGPLWAQQTQKAERSFAAYLQCWADLL